jgi:hypothetical protein
MRGHECYHCKQWVTEGEPHDCWTTTEAALTKDLSEDLPRARHQVAEDPQRHGILEDQARTCRPHHAS